jgi:hypothetical protein
MKFQFLLMPMTLALLFIGCSKHDVESKAPSPTTTRSAEKVIPTDLWRGQWNGPEATFLRIAGGKGTYEITIQNLDGPRNFKGHAAGETIQFERNSVQESLHATTGSRTGMKWLSDKSNCLTVRLGEGYCRN